MSGALALTGDRRRFSLAEFARMVKLGVLDEDERLELIDGELVAMSPTGIGHANCLARLLRLLILGLGDRALVWSQSTLALRIGERDYAPMPDLAVLRPRLPARSYPDPLSILLVAEVADTSQARDRAKLALYGRAGIREGWLVDLKARIVLVHRSPGSTGYRRVQRISRGGTLTMETFPDVTLRVTELLP
jgi:Uma2 family endonuclease